MTNKEAIEVLRSMKSDFPLPKAAQTRRAQNDALDVAIEALKVESCKDTVSRQMLIRHYDSGDFKHIMLLSRDTLLDYIKHMPSVTPKQKIGEWRINSDGYYPYCSECKEEPKNREMTKYCPNCGAKMGSV